MTLELVENKKKTIDDYLLKHNNLLHRSNKPPVRDVIKFEFYQLVFNSLGVHDYECKKFDIDTYFSPEDYIKYNNAYILKLNLYNEFKTVEANINGAELAIKLINAIIAQGVITQIKDKLPLEENKKLSFIGELVQVKDEMGYIIEHDLLPALTELKISYLMFKLVKEVFRFDAFELLMDRAKAQVVSNDLSNLSGVMTDRLHLQVIPPENLIRQLVAISRAFSTEPIKDAGLFTIPEGSIARAKQELLKPSLYGYRNERIRLFNDMLDAQTQEEVE